MIVVAMEGKRKRVSGGGKKAEGIRVCHARKGSEN